MITYVENFYTKKSADALLALIRTLPFVREPNPRQPKYSIRRLSFPGYAVLESHRPSAKYKTLPWNTRPELFKVLDASLTTYARKEVNYLSAVGYLPTDHMNFHQHREDKKNDDQTVYVLSLGAIHPVVIRPAGCEDKSQWEYIYPAHGSLYVLPHEYNTTHEHAVLEGDDYSHQGLRVSINAKHEHIPDPNCTHSAGWRDRTCVLCGIRAEGIYNEITYDPKPFIREPGPPRIYRITKDRKYPQDAVYVGRGGFWSGQEWPATPFGNHKRLNGDAWKAEVARLIASPEFRAQVESLRGKDLLCWCSPKEEAHCHARAWLELANAVKPSNTCVTNSRQA